MSGYLLGDKDYKELSIISLIVMFLRIKYFRRGTARFTGLGGSLT